VGFHAIRLPLLDAPSTGQNISAGIPNFYWNDKSSRFVQGKLFFLCRPVLKIYNFLKMKELRTKFATKWN